jgi:hypothetical protein
LTVALDKLTKDGTNVGIKAITEGGVEKVRNILIKQKPPCDFKILPLADG